MENKKLNSLDSLEHKKTLLKFCQMISVSLLIPVTDTICVSGMRDHC